MDTERIDRSRKALEDLRAELRARLADDDETKPVAPDRAIGRLTRQDAIQSQQMAIELQRRNQERMRLVEQALKRIAEGSYGYCLRCEEEISEARLNVRPEAPLCIECAENRSR